MPKELASMSGTLYFLFLLEYHFILYIKFKKTSNKTELIVAVSPAVLHGNNLLVFGGTGIPFGENNGNDVHVCNVKYKRWSLLNCRGKKPNRIYGQVRTNFC